MSSLTLHQQLLVAKTQAVRQERERAQKVKEEKERGKQETLAVSKARVGAKRVEERAKSTQISMARFLSPELAKLAQKLPHLHDNKERNKKRDKTSTKSDQEKDYDDEFKRLPRERPPNVWGEIYKRDAAKMREEEQQRKTKQQELIEKQQLFLNSQVENKKKSQQQLTNEYQAYAQQNNQELEEYKRQERKKRLELEEKNRIEAQRFKEVLKASHERKQTEKERKIQSELRDVERAKRLLEEDRLRIAKEKMAQAEQLKRVQQENKEQLEIKRREQAKMREEEVKLNEEFKARLDRQAEAREAALAATYARQEKKINAALFMLKSDAEIAREDESKARIVQEKAREVEDRTWHEREVKRREANERNVLELKKQQATKVQERLEEIKANELQAKIWLKEVEGGKQQDSKKAQALKAKNMLHGKILEKQLKDDKIRKKNTNKYGMDERELELNRSLLLELGIAQPGTPTLLLDGARVNIKQ